MEGQADSQPVGRPTSYPGEVHYSVRVPGKDPLRGGDIVSVDLPVSSGDIYDHELAIVRIPHLATDLALVDLAPEPDSFGGSRFLPRHRVRGKPNVPISGKVRTTDNSKLITPDC